MKKIFLLAISLTIVFYANAQNNTYIKGGTEYYTNQYYSTTGMPKVKRSQANKNKFLKSKGYYQVPHGYEVDHIIPLSEGGSDTPSNMQLLTIKEHARKTAKERAKRTNSTYSTLPKYKSNSTYSIPSKTYNNKTILTGSRGGKYYINSNGNKTYIKSNSSKTKSYNYSYQKHSYSTTPSYNSNKIIHTGSRGGKYYINSKGNKTYIKK